MFTRLKMARTQDEEDTYTEHLCEVYGELVSQYTLGVSWRISILWRPVTEAISTQLFEKIDDSLMEKADAN